MFKPNFSYICKKDYYGIFSPFHSYNTNECGELMNGSTNWSTITEKEFREFFKPDVYSNFPYDEATRKICVRVKKNSENDKRVEGLLRKYNVQRPVLREIIDEKVYFPFWVDGIPMGDEATMALGELYNTIETKKDAFDEKTPTEFERFLRNGFLHQHTLRLQRSLKGVYVECRTIEELEELCKMQVQHQFTYRGWRNEPRPWTVSDMKQFLRSSESAFFSKGMTACYRVGEVNSVPFSLYDEDMSEYCKKQVSFDEAKKLLGF